MRIALLSDVHANREALVAVERRLRELEVDSTLFLGDAVGYNADPEFCVGRISELAAAVVRGNHDKAVASRRNLEWFNEVARAAVLWTRAALSRESLAWLQGLPEGPLPVFGRLLICHGSPVDEDLYITRLRDVEAGFRYMRDQHPEAMVCFFGHTHVPLIVEEGGEAMEPPESFHLEAGRRYLINPGSVGQPRDRDPRASFGMLDQEAMVYHHFRLDYPLEITQQKIRAAGLPAMLAERLALGW
jgi:predicted phosphodiesterase